MENQSYIEENEYKPPNFALELHTALSNAILLIEQNIRYNPEDGFNILALCDTLKIINQVIEKNKDVFKLYKLMRENSKAAQDFVPNSFYVGSIYIPNPAYQDAILDSEIKQLNLESLLLINTSTRLLNELWHNLDEQQEPDLYSYYREHLVWSKEAGKIGMSVEKLLKAYSEKPFFESDPGNTSIQECLNKVIDLANSKDIYEIYSELLTIRENADALRNPETPEFVVEHYYDTASLQ